MTRHALSAYALLASMLVAAPAWACAPSGEEMWIVGVFAAAFGALFYAPFGSFVILTQRKRWFATSPLRRWFRASLASYLAAAVGLAAGVSIVFGLEWLGLAIDDTAAFVVALSTPAVVQIAHLMWLHSRRPVTAEVA